MSRIGRTEAGYAEEIAGVIQRHENHNYAAQDIDRFEAEASKGDRICFDHCRIIRSDANGVAASIPAISPSQKSAGLNFNLLQKMPSWFPA